MNTFSVAGRIGLGAVLAAGLFLVLGAGDDTTKNTQTANEGKLRHFDARIHTNALRMIDEGRQAFRFDTFGDEAFWGGMLKLHQAIEGATFGGVGPGVSPKAALDLGLKVDVDALPSPLVKDLENGRVDLDDPATTLALLKTNAVVGVTGFFNADGSLQSFGIQCALCHSTVDNSLAFGIGHRLDGWANRDLDVGQIVASAPDLSAFATLLGISQDTVRQVLNSWGPGKFDAELILDGKAFNPQQVTDGVVTGTNVPGATLLPNAFGLASFNQHTWTGAWGTVTYWNAFVANLEMHGKGRFFDPRLNNATQFPIAAAHGFGDLPHIDPEEDRITKKLPALHFSSWRFRHPGPSRAETLTRRRRSVGRNSSAAKRDATTATSSHCGPSRAGICIDPGRSGSTASRRIVRPIIDTRP
jgi:hypothetical protein